MTTHYHVNSTAEAWKLADKLFPTEEETTYDRLCWLAGHMCSVAVENAPGPMGGESHQRRLRQAIQYTDRVLSLYRKHVITENETVKMLAEIPR